MVSRTVAGFSQSPQARVGGPFFAATASRIAKFSSGNTSIEMAAGTQTTTRVQRIAGLQNRLKIARVESRRSALEFGKIGVILGRGQHQLANTTLVVRRRLLDKTGEPVLDGRPSHVWATVPGVLRRHRNRVCATRLNRNAKKIRGNICDHCSVLFLSRHNLGETTFATAEISPAQHIWNSSTALKEACTACRRVAKR